MGEKQVAAYPFRPKSTAELEAGQFWSIPLPDGRFACGRVLQMNGSQIPLRAGRFSAASWTGLTLALQLAIASRRNRFSIAELCTSADNQSRRGSAGAAVA